MSLNPVQPVEHTTLVFIRHGQTESNAEKRYMGHLDSPLSALGNSQAEAVARRASRLKLDAIYASDLGRAESTAKVIAARCELPLVLDPRLRERHAGVFQGLRISDAKERFPEAFAAIQDPTPDTAIPKGESARHVMSRLHPFLEEVCRRHDGDSVALVSHGIVIRTALWYFLDTSYSRARFARVDNTSLAVFRFEFGRWSLQAWNDTGHLSEM